ncbi:MAG: hypothetical protein PVH68_09095 [Armatimonadota bacterium]
MPSKAELDKLTHEWWETGALHVGDRYVWDEEVKTVNAMMGEIDGLPEWALQVRGAMPKYGFEMCSHRWLDGLDAVVGMIGAEEHWPSSAGHCGDVPGRVIDASERRAAAVQAWLEGQRAPHEADAQVAARLGEPTEEKRQAASCFVELVRAYTLTTDKPGHDRAKALATEWRGRAEGNETLQFMFEGEGLDGLLENNCGFKTVDRLDLYIRIIGGDRSDAGERHGVCNGQLRFVLRDDPQRFDVTRGCLWGLQAYLLGRDEQWLRTNKPDCAGAAIHALRGVSRSGEPTPLRRWLVASLLKSSKLWCQTMLNRMGKEVPAYVRDLPDVVAGVRG